ncbi:MAG: 30S ribosomal protein S8 [candidate division KSB1 bacterium]|nr:30S ribosomal protein S8 [candidate division KSB1 bacterium]MDZ7294372.1 30S ribosomal protein S8 [candidate division KSB1 bacterium]MDZ7384542.1 30S ribosomal protein S8 [candidate division KSB1 bacterium]MDZ7392839.1 30S ribosomal protein S8 [candidate division KSB1 bacterium]MDZ7412569.1 30S ribosomal protein S8 [candidate division KSB1 bacterium]
MSMTDPIADYLTRIRNALRAGHKKVDIPASRLKTEITRILQEQHFIHSFVLVEDGKQGILRIYLRYDENEEPVISGLERVSKPGQRKYVGAAEIPRVLNNLGIAILSTSKGVMTGQQARKAGVGGEVLCYVW